MHLIDIVKQFKPGIIIALSLVAIENVAWIVEPSLWGNVIDALNRCVLVYVCYFN